MGERKSGQRGPNGQALERRLSHLGQSMLDLGRKNVNIDTVINGLVYLESTLPIEELRSRVAENFLQNPRFKSTVIPSKSDQGFKWHRLSDEEVDLTWHVCEAEVPTTGGDGNASQADLDSYVNSHYGKPMDFSRPVWTVELLSNVRNVGPEGKSAACILLRLHHVLGDGISLSAFIMGEHGLFDNDPVAAPIKATNQKKKNKSIWPKIPLHMKLLHQIRVFVQGIVVEGLLVAALPGDTKTALKGSVKGIHDRKVAASKGVALDKIKDIKDPVNATVNDVLVAALAGVIRRYLTDKCDQKVSRKTKMRAACLVNMRSKEETQKLMGGSSGGDILSNQFNFLPMAMPVGTSDPLQRLYTCKRLMDDIKISPGPLVAYKVNMLAGKVLPKEQVFEATYSLFDKFTCIFSNVPGPQQAKSIDGVEVQGMTFFANSLTATAFSLVSYNGKVQLGVVAEPSVVPDPQELVDLFDDEIDALYKATRGDFQKPRVDKQSEQIDIAVVSFLGALLLALLVNLLL